MVVPEVPGIHGAIAFAAVLAEAIEESGLVLGVLEDDRSTDPSDHDVIQGAWDV